MLFQSHYTNINLNSTVTNAITHTSLFDYEQDSLVNSLFVFYVVILVIISLHWFHMHTATGICGCGMHSQRGESGILWDAGCRLHVTLQDIKQGMRYLLSRLFTTESLV